MIMIANLIMLVLTIISHKRYMKYGQEIATMLNYQFTELSNEVLSLISNNSIDSNEVKVLRSKILNLILPNFNMSYAQLFDKH